MAEMLGGFSPVMLLGAARSMSAIRYVANSIQKHLFPFTTEGAWQRTSKRLRDLAADPKRSAGKVDAQSEMPPARQTGDERLLALEKAVLDENPDIASDTNRLLNSVRETLKEEVLDVFGGDKDRPRKILIAAKQYLIDLCKPRQGRGLQFPCPVESPLTGLTSPHAGALLDEYNQCLKCHKM